MLKKISRFLSLIFLVSLASIFVFNESIAAHEKPLTDSQKILAQNSEAVNIRIIPLKDNIYMLTGEGGNIGLSVGDDGVLMIDSQFAYLSDKIKDEIKLINRRPINYLINTHYHFDHVGGNENFANDGALIIAHDNTFKQMQKDHSYPVLGMDVKASPVSALPKITFNDVSNFHINGNHIKAFAVPPAHTNSDIVIHFAKENIIHTGDLFFNGFYPFIDTEAGGSIDGMISAIDQILALCNEQTIIIPGHGERGDRTSLMKFQEMLKTVNERVKQKVAQNMTLDDIISEKPLADLDQEWGDGFLTSDQFLTIAYQGIKN